MLLGQSSSACFSYSCNPTLSRNALDLTVTGQLTNRDKGLINAAETLKITSGDLNNRGGQLLGGSALTASPPSRN